MIKRKQNIQSLNVHFGSFIVYVFGGFWSTENGKLKKKNRNLFAKFWNVKQRHCPHKIYYESNSAYCLNSLHAALY